MLGLSKETSEYVTREKKQKSRGIQKRFINSKKIVSKKKNPEKKSMYMVKEIRKQRKVRQKIHVNELQRQKHKQTNKKKKH